MLNSLNGLFHAHKPGNTTVDNVEKLLLQGMFSAFDHLTNAALDIANAPDCINTDAKLSATTASHGLVGGVAGLYAQQTVGKNFVVQTTAYLAK